MDERDKLQFAVRDLESHVTARIRAMDQLRTNVPPHVKRVRDQLVGQLKNSHLNRERLELKSKVRSLAGLENLVHWSPANNDSIVAIITGIPKADRPAGILNDRGQVHKKFWSRLANQRLADLPALESRLSELQGEFDLKLEAIDQQLDFYLSDRDLI